MYEKLTEIIEASNNIVFFGGAGVSTESGIPDFRSESGIYKTRTEYNRSPEEIISLSFFMREPAIFFDYYKKNFIYMDAKPNDAHLALGRLEARGKLAAVVTQNVDGLHQLGGSQNVIELHGSVRRNYCMDCAAPYDVEYILDPANCFIQDAASGEGTIPHCALCGGMVRPDVVLYEEALDMDVMHAAVSAIAEADTLIVGGTSLVVYPAAGFLNHFKGSNLVLINRSETPYDGRASLIIHDFIGQVLKNV